MDEGLVGWGEMRRLAWFGGFVPPDRGESAVRVRGRYAAWPALAAVLAVGACSGGDDPPATTSSSSTSTTSTTTTTPPTTPTTPTTTVPIPAAARQHTPAGAEAFVRFYIDQLNDAWTKPDSQVLPPLSDRDCVACKSLQDTAVSLTEKKQHYASDPVTVTKVVPLQTQPGGVQLVRLFMDQHKVNVLDSTGKVVLTDSAKRLARTVGVAWKGDSWRLFDME